MRQFVLGIATETAGGLLVSIAAGWVSVGTCRFDAVGASSVSSHFCVPVAVSRDNALPINVVYFLLFDLFGCLLPPALALLLSDTRRHQGVCCRRP